MNKPSIVSKDFPEMTNNARFDSVCTKLMEPIICSLWAKYRQTVEFAGITIRNCETCQHSKYFCSKLQILN